jgi:hypothetical protein
MLLPEKKFYRMTKQDLPFTTKRSDFSGLLISLKICIWIKAMKHGIISEQLSKGVCQLVIFEVRPGG